MSELILKNARLVLADKVFHGTLRIRGGVIDSIEGGTTQTGEDLEEDWLLPGLVELHTDHLESHYAPRPGVRWNPVAAVQAHDAQIAASGITTVFDALRIGMDEDARITAADMRLLADSIESAKDRGRLRADHFIHLRCEVSSPDTMDGFSLFEADENLKIASLMDHTPGQRQFTTLESYRIYYQGKTGMSDEAFQAFADRRQAQAGKWSGSNRKKIAAACRDLNIVLASHDDATPEHVDEAAGFGITVSEFPTTMEAARASREAGMCILMGAPNAVRGGSHSGNVSTRDLAELGLLDAMSSDYVPFSLLHAGFLLAESVESLSLPKAIAMISRDPARAVGLEDRGEITPGKRADLVRVRMEGEVPIVRCVWRQGRRVA